jgi:hypothetical protein
VRGEVSVHTHLQGQNATAKANAGPSTTRLRRFAQDDRVLAGTMEDKALNWAMDDKVWVEYDDKSWWVKGRRHKRPEVAPNGSS